MSDREPGHYQPGADSNHFLGRCLECDAHYILARPLDEVESWYHQGMISQSQWEAFTHVWATSAFRYGSYDAWERPPAHPDALAQVALFRSIIMKDLPAS